MSYWDAAEHASKAAKAAATAHSHASDHYQRKMAEAANELARAVKELSDQMLRDN